VKQPKDLSQIFNRITDLFKLSVAKFMCSFEWWTA